jgi:NNP family nitrate/nitrite transporter-like MFS transporter
VGLTIPFGYLIGGGVIPTLIGVMGDARSFAFGFVMTGILIICAGMLALLLNLPAAAKSTA